MDEYFIQFLWRFQKVKTKDLRTVDGSELKIFHPGFQNFDSGPDFKEAKLKLDGITWSGSVEIHYRASDWLRHGHQKDSAYQNVVLHVVWINDQIIEINGKPLPTLLLNNFVDGNLDTAYKAYINRKETIRCQPWLNQLGSIHFQNLLDRALAARLKEKCQQTLNDLSSARGDWEETTYRTLARNFGFKVNAMPFTLLSRGLSFKTVRKYVHSDFQLTTLLLGMSGLIPNGYIEMKNEFDYLIQKEELEPILETHHWQKSKMRPANFPSLRIAQFAALLFGKKNLFASLISIDSIDNAINFSRPETKQLPMLSTLPGFRSMGKSSIENLLINSIVPILSAYSKYQDDIFYLEKAEALLHQIHPEKNRITKKWIDIGVNPIDAAESQALIFQYNNYCATKKCLLCNIGVQILG